MKADVTVIGGGLAGSILAWTLRERGLRTILIDDHEGSGCSRAAAGLYHPITGKRLTLAENAPTLLRVGQALFGRIERSTGTRVDHRFPIRRAFTNPEMAETWERKRSPLEKAGLEFSEFGPDNSGAFRAPYGGYELEGCGYVDTEALLSAIARSFANEDRYLGKRIAPTELAAESPGLLCPGLESDAIVFAEGHLGRRNPIWSFLPLKPNRGEILEIAIMEPIRECIYLGDLFLVPRGNGNWAAGATHEWSSDDDHPTREGRKILERRIREVLRPDFRVVGHRAGVRPASADTNPFLGRHPDHPRAWVFNGFGSRSVLLAPFHATLLADALIEGKSIPDKLDIRRFQPRTPPPARIRPSRIAQASIAEVIGPGDIAIDATSGNGHDTLWLAGQVGAEGSILGLDIQAAAIEATLNRLESAGLGTRVRLVQGDHGRLPGIAPTQWCGKVAAVMFNLGTLPHGDPAIRTAADSTLKALEAARQMLRIGGRISVILHPGDPAGAEETTAVRRWSTRLPADHFKVEDLRGPGIPERAPSVLVITKRR